MAGHGADAGPEQGSRQTASGGRGAHDAAADRADDRAVGAAPVGGRGAAAVVVSVVMVVTVMRGGHAGQAK